MYWADKIAKEIISSDKYKPYWVDDMKTPSGRIHVGSLRGVVIHDLVYKALLAAGQKAKFTYVFDSHDPMDALPVYLDTKKWSKYLGQPLFMIPSPYKGSKNYAEFFAKEFERVFNKIGCIPEILWTSDLYMSGKMNEGVALCLDKADVVRGIYEKMYNKKLPDNWYPFQVVCPKCGKESTTKVTDWDGKEVTFVCEIDAVPYTKGCGEDGKISPFSSKDKFVGKLSWKVEWPVKWQVIGVTVEGAGKDHMSAGGSHDIAKQVCEKVLDYPVPYPIAYEFFLIGGRKMSSSKGLGTSAKEISDVLPPYLLRFLFTRTDYKEAINFDPVGTMAIPDLFDEYDKADNSYWEKSDENLARIFELSQIGKELPKRTYLPRFRDVIQVIQMPDVDPMDYFSGKKGDKLTKEEKGVLEERIKYAKVWLENYASDDWVFEFQKELPEAVSKLSNEQKEYLSNLIALIEQSKDASELETKMYELSQKTGISAKDAFSAIYFSLIGKAYGPKAAWLIFGFGKEKVVKRFKEI